jgi:hypothetical protein
VPEGSVIASPWSCFSIYREMNGPADTFGRILRIAAAIAGSAAIAASAGAQASAPPSPASVWFQPSDISVELSAGPGQPAARLEAQAFQGGDSRIRLETVEAGKSVHVEMYVIGNRVWLVRGVEPTEGYEIDTLNEPVATMQLVLNLLALAAPDGPASIDAPRDVHREGKLEPIRVQSVSTVVVYPAPWSIEGGLAPAPASRIAYRLDFRRGEEKTAQSLHVEGAWDGSAPRALPGETALGGFKAYELEIHRTAAGAVVDSGARKLPAFATVSEVRSRAPGR